MAEIGSGDFKARQAKKAAEAVKQSEAGLATQGLKLRCDVNGCVIVPINANEYTPGLTGKQHTSCVHTFEGKHGCISVTLRVLSSMHAHSQVTHIMLRKHVSLYPGCNFSLTSVNSSDACILHHWVCIGC